MGKPIFLYPQATLSPSASVTATDSYTGTEAADILQPTEYTFWRPETIVGTKTVIIDYQLGQAMAALALLGEGLDGVVVTVTGANDAAFSTAVVLANNITLESAVNAAWVLLPLGTYRYLKLEFSEFGSDFRVAWACACSVPDIPYLKRWDGDNVGEAGTAVVSPKGLYLGSNRIKSMKHLPLDFGYITNAGYSSLKQWAATCISAALPFFLVPDGDNNEVYFGWLKTNTFSGPTKTTGGLRQITSMTMITRGE